MTTRKRKRAEANPVGTVQEFLRAVDRLAPAPQDRRGEWFFRGQSDSTRDLRPQIDRDEWKCFRDDMRLHDPSFDRVEHEKWLLKEFQKAALPHVTVRADSPFTWEWIAAAQHHGLATRLLDWAASPLAALFFAVEDARSQALTSAVVAYLPTGKSHVSYPDPFSICEVVSFTPRHVSPRITAQGGRFTAHPEMSPRDWNEWERKLVRITIPLAARPRIRRELARLGITWAAIYPDIDGIAKATNYRYMVQRDEILPRPSANRALRLPASRGTARAKKRTGGATRPRR